MSSIIIKGNKDGILININSNNYEEVKDELVSKISKSKEFFTGSKIMIVDNNFKLSNECFIDLQNTLKEMFNITITILDYDINDLVKKYLPEYPKDELNLLKILFVQDKR